MRTWRSVSTLSSVWRNDGDLCGLRRHWRDLMGECWWRSIKKWVTQPSIKRIPLTSSSLRSAFTNRTTTHTVMSHTSTDVFLTTEILIKFLENGLLLLLIQMSWITVLPSHSCGGTLQNPDIKLLHSSVQTSADDRSRRCHEKGETWSPSGMSKVRCRPESLVADCSMHVH